MAATCSLNNVAPREANNYIELIQSMLRARSGDDTANSYETELTAYSHLARTRQPRARRRTGARCNGDVLYTSGLQRIASCPSK